MIASHGELTATTAGSGFPLLLGARLPPANLQAEQALLGALLANNKAWARVQEAGLEPRHFADSIHGAIFAAIRARVSAGRLADVVTLRHEFEHAGTLDEVGGPAYLAQLLTAMVGIVNAGEYARLIRDLWLRRELLEHGETLVRQCYGEEGGGLDGSEIAALAARRVHDLQRHMGGGGSVHRVGAVCDEAEAAEEAAAARGGLAGLPLGFPALDALLCGLEDGDMIVAAGRPGSGKSSFGLQAALRVALRRWKSLRARQADPSVPEERGRVVICCLEMTRVQMVQRATSILTRIPLNVIRSGAWRGSTRDAERVVAARRFLAELPIAIEDTEGLTPEAIERSIREGARLLGGVDFAVLDHLHKVRDAPGARRDSETARVSAASNACKEMAKGLRIPMLVLAQLSRGPEQREDKRPTLGDLRQSGTIEEDAAAVIGLYRPEYYAQAEPEQRAGESDPKYRERLDAHRAHQERVRGVAEAIVLKNRHGDVGTATLGWEGHCTRFADSPDDIHRAPPEMQKD